MKAIKGTGKIRAASSGQFAASDPGNDPQLRGDVLKLVEAFDLVSEALDSCLVGLVRDKRREPVAMISQTLLLLGGVRSVVASELHVAGVSVPEAPDLEVMSNAQVSRVLAVVASSSQGKGRRK
ncbi:MAG: hypothetical protein HYX42_11920 [Polaromonas sp.]|uniref:hypothetical protein n=1 Tax=Polaromonas sp. TaxID=1869339 RepID=UPI0025DDCC11|nr:hypothetical protein [Polaromonas sp.]MBI2726942.1 hypothetical protein [Polaromonas sp.]